MIPNFPLLKAARMFHSRNIEELADGLAEDDDAPDGAAFMKRSVTVISGPSSTSVRSRR
jgi:hypothetical protein